MGKRANLIRKLDAQTRPLVRARDRDRCVVCGRQADHVHEILARSHFGTDNLHVCYEPRNRCCLCVDHHNPMAHTFRGRVKLLKKMQELYAYSYEDLPFSGYF